MIMKIQDVLFIIAVIICVVSSVKKCTLIYEEQESPFIKKYAKILFFIILILFSISISYKLKQVPQGLHVDEAGAFYDAICISNYGVDRYLYKFPVYLINFGGGQSALYAYLAAIMIKIFGNYIIVFRMPSILLSLALLVCFYKIVAESHSKIQALLSILVLAVCPWNIMRSRWGLDCNLMCSMMLISLYFFIKAVKTNKRYLYAITGIFFGLTLYTYVISYLVIPIILAILLGYLFIIQKTSFKDIICIAIPLGILAIPLFLMILYNSNIITNATIPIFSIPKLWFFRGGEISLRNISNNLKNIFDVLFVKDFLNYNAIPEFGTLYKLSIPLVVFGLIKSVKCSIKAIKQKKFTLDLMMVVTFVVIFSMALCIEDVNINKINAIYVPMIYFAGVFLYTIFRNSKYLGIVIISLYCINFVIFLNYYFTDFANTKLSYFENDIIQASKRAEELDKSCIYVENSLNQTYIYTLIATPVSPYEWNENLLINNGIIVQYGKYKFEIPSQIDKEAVYIIKNDNSKINELLENGFTLEEYGEFKILFMRSIEK